MLGLDRWRLRQPVLHGREDLDSLDRINTQVCVKLHVKLEHVDRVTCLVGHDGTQGLGDLVAGFSDTGWRHGNRSRNWNSGMRVAGGGTVRGWLHGSPGCVSGR